MYLQTLTKTRMYPIVMAVSKSTAANAHPGPEFPFTHATESSLPSVIRMFSFSVSPNPHVGLFLAKFL